MKRFNTYVSLAATAVLLFAGACSVDPIYESPRTEKYTQDFIREFGLIDPNQDWNMAKDATISINLGEKEASSVKVYGKMWEGFYLVADLTDVSGIINVPVDVPKSCKEIMVKVDGTSFYG